MGGIYLARTIEAKSGSAEVTTTERSLAAVSEATPKIPRVGLQAGHWKNTELPDELETLRNWSTGAYVAGINEWEVNLEIAEGVAKQLRKSGVEVDVLPSTVPVGYEADAFISIHADGNDDTTVSGFKVVPSDWDLTGKAKRLSSAIEASYGAMTGMEVDPSDQIAMREYYAFNYERFHHAIDKDTPGVIMELGFLTNSQDRFIIVNKQAQMIEGITQGVKAYLGL